MIITGIFYLSLSLLLEVVITVKGYNKDVEQDVLLIKRSSDSDDVKVHDQSGSENDEANKAALTLLNLSTSVTHVPASNNPKNNLTDDLYLSPRKRRTTTQRIPSKKRMDILPTLDQTKISKKYF